MSSNSSIKCGDKMRKLSGYIKNAAGGFGAGAAVGGLFDTSLPTPYKEIAKILNLGLLVGSLYVAADGFKES